jgi:hypothetical protein
MIRIYSLEAEGGPKAFSKRLEAVDVVEKAAGYALPLIIDLRSGVPSILGITGRAEAENRRVILVHEGSRETAGLSEADQKRLGRRANREGVTFAVTEWPGSGTSQKPLIIHLEKRIFGKILDGKGEIPLSENIEAAHLTRWGRQVILVSPGEEDLILRVGPARYRHRPFRGRWYLPILSFPGNERVTEKNYDRYAALHGLETYVLGMPFGARSFPRFLERLRRGRRKAS